MKKEIKFCLKDELNIRLKARELGIKVIQSSTKNYPTMDTVDRLIQIINNQTLKILTLEKEKLELEKINKFLKGEITLKILTLSKYSEEEEKEEEKEEEEI